MHIEFKKLILHNFMSFGDAELLFLDDGFIKVSGINDNPLDNAGSNGSGKSSLWEAIVWTLTGETIRGTKNIVNFYGDDGCFVELEFDIDKKHYHIIRSKDHKVRKTNLQIFIDNQDVSGKGIRDSEKLLQGYLPDITASLLGSVIILGQGLPQKFTNNTPSGRKEVLEKLSKSDFMIEDLKKRVSERKSVLTQEIRGYEDVLLKLTTETEFLQKQIKENSYLIQTCDKEQLVTSCNDLAKQIEELSLKQSHYESQLNDLLEQQKTLTDNKAMLFTAKNDEVEKILQSVYAEQQPIEQAFMDNRAQEKVLKEQLLTMQNIRDVCPTCGQKLPNVHKPDTTQLELDIKVVTETMASLKSRIQDIKQTADVRVSEVKHDYDSKLFGISNDLCSVGNNITSYKTSKQQVTTELQSLQQIYQRKQNDLAQIDATIDACNKIIHDNNEKLNVISDKIMYNIKQKDLTFSHLDVINKFDTSLKRDFRGYLLSTVIAFIEQRAKYYSKIIFDTEEICFCLDGNNIDISYMNKPYENLSGGEKQKIDLIIQFSIRDMLAKQLNFTSNILVLDEVFDGLDSIGCSRVIDMIASVSDIKNIFIVTHRKDLSIPNDKELIIVKSSARTSEIR